jgi:hypothetical protein
VTWTTAALWGILGGIVIEGLDFYNAVRQHGKAPWHVTGKGGQRISAGIYLAAELVRLLIGGIVAGAAAASGQISGPLIALALGVATPLAVERLVTLIPLAPRTSPGAASQTAMPPGLPQPVTEDGGQ